MTYRDADFANDERARSQLAVGGFANVLQVIDDAARLRLLEVLVPERRPSTVRHRSGVAFASRHLLAHVPGLTDQLRLAGLDELASRFLGKTAFPVDATYFDKSPGANWAVPTHQDRILPVANGGSGPLKLVKGVPVAEPSATTLGQLLALRVHFDPTDAENGALFVSPGSHGAGVLTVEQIKAIPLTSYVPCAAGAGDVLLMRPLLLHRSPPTRGTGRRRVLHVVYATAAPDTELRWLEAKHGDAPT
jgi:Phytanoyl-CoA dioxygenase (PhyH)